MLSDKQLKSERAFLLSASIFTQQSTRPIFVTTVTTVGGMMPLWISHDPMFETLAIAVIFGLAFATMITLLFVPVLYAILYRVKWKY